jgi:cytochrome c-type biogenesis protein CcmF
LPWRAAGAEVLHHRLVAPAAAAAAVMLAAALGGLRGLAPLGAVGLGSFALAGIVRSFAVGLAARRRTTGERAGRAFVRMVAANSRLYGGLVVHVGVVLFALAFTFSSSFSVEKEAALRPGESTSLRGYTVTYMADREDRSARKTTVSADLRVARGGRTLGTYAPALSTFAGSQQPIGTPSVRNGLREDVYLTLVAAPDAGRVVVGVRVNPTVVWLWIGAGVMVAGTAIAAWPTGRRRPKQASVEAPIVVPGQPPAPELVGAGTGGGP